MSGFSALLVGNESLTRECGSQLLARGHLIAAVVTDDAGVRAWAEGADLHVIAQDAGWEAALDGLQFDWLLSVANLKLIAASALQQAARGAVNFHDGPLPAYAGLNAPVWAILQGEAQHGITWHLIGDGIDDGDILVQRMFEISRGETAFSLNTRCFAAAIDSFPDLMAQLEHGLQPTPQDASRRTVFRRDDRPAAFGRIDFTKDVSEVLRLVNGLDHGTYWNPLTTAKVVVGGQVLNVGAASPAEGAGAPGEILAATDGTLVVACGGGAVALTGLTCQSLGLPVDRASLHAGRLDGLATGEADHLTSTARRVARKDGKVRRHLLQLIPASVEGARPAAQADWQMVALPDARNAAAPALGHLVLAASRLSGQPRLDFALSLGPSNAPGYVSDWVPLRVEAGLDIATGLAAMDADIAGAADAPGFALDLLTRERALTGLDVPQIGLSANGKPVPGTVMTLVFGALAYDRARLSEAQAEALASRIAAVAGRIAAAPTAQPLASVPILSDAERQQVITDHNNSEAPYAQDLCLHQAFEAQVLRSPDAVALICDGDALTYGNLNARANQVAHVLAGLGVRPGMLVGLCIRRSLDMVVGALAIQKAGGAYVPMDPGYPADRIALYIEDSACPVIVTQAGISLPPHTAKVLEIDRDPAIDAAPSDNPSSGVTAADLAYMIYTSGSTGRPKGVMVEHRNVLNFFAGMDLALGTAPGTWMAVTSLSFDISVLELFWTLARGFKVVLSSDDQRALVSSGPRISAKGMEFSLYYWGNDDGAGARKYELLMEGARFADDHGFCAVWTPERHFHAFGGPYPNPSVTGAAIAGMTRNIGVRAGSCVAPLHHPARIAEEWAVIDNLTDGRAGIAFASGWQPDDFVLRPENTPPGNKAAMLTSIDQVRRLWRGEAVDFPTAKGTFAVTTQPRPVSKELPVWVTTAGNPDTWREAGTLGANVLTHLLGQSIDEVAGKIRLYHDALRGAGHDPADRTVTLMLHTFVAETRDTAREISRGPMKDYLRSAAALIKQYAWAFPAFKKPAGVSNPMDIDMGSLTAEDLDAILDFAFQRYFEESGLFGTVEDALARVETLKAIGVDEVACLIDYGIATETVLAGLRPLAEVVRRANAGGEAGDGDHSIAAQIARHRVTHLQCTPSMARMIATAPEARATLSGVGTLMLGGEALSGGLVGDLRALTSARILNMYGPTETTIWSSTTEVTEAEPVANIGKPLANQQMYVLDDALEPVAPGDAGELWIGGHGVTRGYWQRPDLTADRYRPDPFVTADRAAPWGARMYRTGDLVRWRADGRLDFLGRADGQVKLRGYRIELGEIEAVLERQAGVTQAVVLMREDVPGDARLVAYVTGPAVAADLKSALALQLPDHMVPAHVVTVERFPLTPNRKVDRKALPLPVARTGQDTTEAAAPPAAGIEAEIAAIWSRILGVPKIGRRDNFFALGGHSLLAVQVHREIRDALGAKKLSITDIFRFPTLGALAAHLDDRPAVAEDAADDRAEARSDAMSRRAAMRMRRGGVDA